MSDAPAGRSRPSVFRPAFYVVSSAIILWASLAVPLPFVETVPGDPAEIPPLVEIEGIEIDELDGSTALLTIQQRQQATLPAFAALVDPDRSLRPVEEVIPQDIDHDVYRQLQRQQFGRQFDIATAVGAEAAGIETELVTQVAVVDVLPGSPADGLLQPGDVVSTANGRPLTDAEQLQDITAAAEPGDELVLSIVRDGQEDEVTAQLEAAPDTDGARLGVRIETSLDELRLPFDVDLREGNRIGGPSAGMMIGVTIYDLLADEDLLQGRTVVGTGTLSSSGQVGPVGGVPQKMVAAANYGADLVLVPASQVDVAESAAPESLRIVGVSSLEEAIEVLRNRPV